MAFKHIIGPIIGGIGSLFGSGASYKGQKDTNKTNIALAEQARTHDVNMWNKQNAYNTPEMQMQRLKEAGLNPNLIYGSGQASTGNADAPQKSPVATTSNELATFANNQAIQILSQYNDWQIKKQQLKNMETERQAVEIQNTLNAHNIPFGEQLAQDKSFLSQGQTELQRYQARTLREQYRETLRSQESRMGLHDSRLGESKQRIENLRKSSRQKQLQIELDEQLKPYGMSSSDELWQRLLAPVFKEKFDGIMNFMDNPKQHFKNTFYKNKKK